MNAETIRQAIEAARDNPLESVILPMIRGIFGGTSDDHGDGQGAGGSAASVVESIADGFAAMDRSEDGGQDSTGGENDSESGAGIGDEGAGAGEANGVSEASGPQVPGAEGTTEATGPELPGAAFEFEGSVAGRFPGGEIVESGAGEGPEQGGEYAADASGEGGVEGAPEDGAGGTENEGGFGLPDQASEIAESAVEGGLEVASADTGIGPGSLPEEAAAKAFAATGLASGAERDADGDAGETATLALESGDETELSWSEVDAGEFPGIPGQPGDLLSEHMTDASKAGIPEDIDAFLAGLSTGVAGDDAIPTEDGDAGQPGFTEQLFDFV